MPGRGRTYGNYNPSEYNNPGDIRTGAPTSQESTGRGNRPAPGTGPREGSRTFVAPGEQGLYGDHLSDWQTNQASRRGQEARAASRNTQVTLGGAAAPLEERLAGMPEEMQYSGKVNQPGINQQMPDMDEYRAQNLGVTADPLSETDQMYQDLMTDWEDSWENRESSVDAQAARDQRRAAEISAGLGAAVGGGTFAGGMAQASLAGQERMYDARYQHDIRGLEIQMTIIQQKLDRAEAEEEWDLARELRSKIDETNIMIERLRQSNQTNPPETPEAEDDGTTWYKPWTWF